MRYPGMFREILGPEILESFNSWDILGYPMRQAYISLVKYHGTGMAAKDRRECLKNGSRWEDKSA